MAQYHIKNPEEDVICPYDPSHVVPAKKLQYHLTKCKKNFRNYKVCPFNATHHVPSHEFRHHVENCHDKIIIEPEISYESKKAKGEETTLKGYTDLPEYKDIPIESEENWDEEISAITSGLHGLGYDDQYHERFQFRDSRWGLQRQPQFEDARAQENLRYPKGPSMFAMNMQPKLQAQPMANELGMWYGQGRAAPPPVNVGGVAGGDAGIGRGMANTYPGMSRGLAYINPGIFRGVAKGYTQNAWAMANTNPGIGMANTNPGIGMGVAAGYTQNAWGVANTNPGIDMGMANTNQGIGTGVANTNPGIGMGVVNTNPGIGWGIANTNPGICSGVAVGYTPNAWAAASTNLGICKGMTEGYTQNALDAGNGKVEDAEEGATGDTGSAFTLVTRKKRAKDRGRGSWQGKPRFIVPRVNIP